MTKQEEIMAGLDVFLTMLPIPLLEVPKARDELLKYLDSQGVVLICGNGDCSSKIFGNAWLEKLI